MRFSQLSGLIRYEMVLQWRQRMLTGVLLSLIALPLIMYVLFGQNNAAEVQRTWTIAGSITTEAALNVTTRYAIMYAAMSIYLIALLVLPVVSADVIARDRQLGVREVLEGLPVTPGTYLAGKLLGWWAAAGSGLLVAMVIVGVGVDRPVSSRSIRGHVDRLRVGHWSGELRPELAHRLRPTDAPPGHHHRRGLRGPVFVCQYLADRPIRRVVECPQPGAACHLHSFHHGGMERSDHGASLAHVGRHLVADRWGDRGGCGVARCVDVDAKKMISPTGRLRTDE
jgi:hypothetical protein